MQRDGVMNIVKKQNMSVVCMKIICIYLKALLKRRLTMSNNDGVGPGGKGDKPRPINDRQKFEENFERIFGKKEKQNDSK